MVKYVEDTSEKVFLFHAALLPVIINTEIAWARQVGLDYRALIDNDKTPGRGPLVENIRHMQDSIGYNNFNFYYTVDSLTAKNTQSEHLVPMKQSRKILFDNIDNIDLSLIINLAFLPLVTVATAEHTKLNRKLKTKSFNDNINKPFLRYSGITSDVYRKDTRTKIDINNFTLDDHRSIIINHYGNIILNLLEAGFKLNIDISSEKESIKLNATNEIHKIWYKF